MQRPARFSIIVGSHAVALICGGDNWEILGNAICATGHIPTAFNGNGKGGLPIVPEE